MLPHAAGEQLLQRLAETVHALDPDTRDPPTDRPWEEQRDLARLLLTAAAWYQVAARDHHRALPVKAPDTVTTGRAARGVLSGVGRDHGGPPQSHGDRLVGMVTLRVLTTDDWPLWRTLRFSALADAPHAFKSRLADWHRGEEERWRVRLEIPGAYHVAALLDGHAVGMASGLPGDGGTRELRSVWVSTGARGRGIGTRLIAAVETWALESGGAVLKLAVLPGNEAALTLYRRSGFTTTGEPCDVSPDGMTGQHVMVKALRRV
ncbi:GNAT family N-acetyltransferase [Kitasatospora sp. NPDC058170]|uniref:GNAT family N-acetyltransferase n=1 Tax=Kitasatospora sp. NPDC058170 TaxID=3346364 RepID=UPI0036D76551